MGQMTTLKLRPALVLLSVLLAGWKFVPAAGAAGLPKFSVTVKSAYLHSAPSFDAPLVFSVFKDQAFVVVGRQAGDEWLRLEVGNGVSAAWVPAQYGTIQGSLANAPLGSSAPEPPAP